MLMLDAAKCEYWRNDTRATTATVLPGQVDAKMIVCSHHKRRGFFSLNELSFRLLRALWETIASLVGVKLTDNPGNLLTDCDR